MPFNETDDTNMTGPHLFSDKEVTAIVNTAISQRIDKDVVIPPALLDAHALWRDYPRPVIARHCRKDIRNTLETVNQHLHTLGVDASLITKGFATIPENSLDQPAHHMHFLPGGVFHKNINQYAGDNLVINAMQEHIQYIALLSNPAIETEKRNALLVMFPAALTPNEANCLEGIRERQDIPLAQLRLQEIKDPHQQRLLQAHLDVIQQERSATTIWISDNLQPHLPSALEYLHGLETLDSNARTTAFYIPTHIAWNIITTHHQKLHTQLAANRQQTIADIGRLLDSHPITVTELNDQMVRNGHPPLPRGLLSTLVTRGATTGRTNDNQVAMFDHLLKQDAKRTILEQFIPRPSSKTGELLPLTGMIIMQHLQDNMARVQKKLPEGVAIHHFTDFDENTLLPFWNKDGIPSALNEITVSPPPYRLPVPTNLYSEEAPKQLAALLADEAETHQTIAVRALLLLGHKSQYGKSPIQVMSTMHELAQLPHPHEVHPALKNTLNTILTHQREYRSTVNGTTYAAHIEHKDPIGIVTLIHGNAPAAVIEAHFAEHESDTRRLCLTHLAKNYDVVTNLFYHPDSNRIFSTLLNRALDDDQEIANVTNIGQQLVALAAKHKQIDMITLAMRGFAETGTSESKLDWMKITHDGLLMYGNIYTTTVNGIDHLANHDARLLHAVIETELHPASYPRLDPKILAKSGAYRQTIVHRLILRGDLVNLSRVIAMIPKQHLPNRVILLEFANRHLPAACGLLEKATALDGTKPATAVDPLDRTHPLLAVLREMGANLEGVDKEGNTVLHYAIKHQLISAIKIIKEQYPNLDVNAVNKSGYTAMHEAVGLNDSKAIEALLAIGANIDAQGSYDNALHDAIFYRRMEAAATLLHHGASVEANNRLRETAMHMAIGDVVCMRLLLAYNANIEARDIYQQTPLHRAASKFEDNPASVELLCDYHADIEAKARDDQTAMHKAAEHDNKEIIIALKNRGANIHAQTTQGRTPLHVAINKSNQVPETLLELGADPDIPDKAGDTALLYAMKECYSRLKDTIILLKRHGARLDAQNLLGQTALHLAKFFRVETDVMETLITLGADVNAKDKTDETPLHVMAGPYGADPKKMTLLLDHGADIHAVDNEGKTAFHHATYAGCNEKMTLLLNHGADIHAVDNKGNTALYYAGPYRLVLVDWLIERGLDINAKNKIGNTIMHQAVYYGAIDSFAKLKERGADIDARNNDGLTPFVHAVRDNYLPSINKLKKLGADVHATDYNEKSAMHYAAISGYIQTIAALKEFGVALGNQDCFGKTPLHYAAQHGTVPAIELFHSYGVDINVLDKEGNTPLDIAMKHEKADAVAALKTIGARSAPIGLRTRNRKRVAEQAAEESRATKQARTEEAAPSTPAATEVEAISSGTTGRRRSERLRRRTRQAEHDASFASTITDEQNTDAEGSRRTSKRLQNFTEEVTRERTKNPNPTKRTRS